MNPETLTPAQEKLREKFPNATAAFLRLNAEADDNRNPPSQPIDPPWPKEKAKNRIRQNSQGLNKTEQAFFEYLKGHPRYKNSALAQSVTLKIGNGVRYTVDFVCPVSYQIPLSQNPNYYQIEAFETKGYAREDSIVKLKVAASLYAWIKFHLVTRKKGEWQIQEILP